MNKLCFALEILRVCHVYDRVLHLLVVLPLLNSGIREDRQVHNDSLRYVVIPYILAFESHSR